MYALGRLIWQGFFLKKDESFLKIQRGSEENNSKMIQRERYYSINNPWRDAFMLDIE